MDLKSKLEAAKQKLADVKARLTDADVADIAAFKELADLESEREAEERKQRNLELDRRVIAAQEVLGPEVKIEPVSVQEWPDTFIVMRNGKAHGAWTKATTNAATAAANGKKDIDRESINRKYAIQVIYDWNGYTDFATNTERSKALNDFLIENPGILVPITNAAAMLAGVFAEERKSGA
ncbi:MAG TPA: hypothetical protein VK550_12290 [Polyangiaceae bacterium]|nr:hypothetical protein [Polyangiaceae bacterium]